MEEATKVHREIKNDILHLLGLMENPKTTKEKMKNDLFKIYLKVK